MKNFTPIFCTVLLTRALGYVQLPSANGAPRPRRPRLNRNALSIFGVALGATSLVPAFAAPYGQVSVAGVSVQGLNREEATRRLKRELAPKLNYQVRVESGAKAVKRRRRDLGIELDVGWMLGRAARGDRYVPLKLRADLDASRSALRRLAPKFEVEQRPARPVFYRGNVVIRPETVGQTLNLGAAPYRLKQQIERDASRRSIDLPARKSAPDLTEARLKGVNAVLATYTTRFNPGEANRTHNLKRGIGQIDGKLLSPNEVFSLNETVGARSPERGFKKATIFEDRMLEKDYGGGISQVTGTIFNAALEAGLPIVFYRTHTRPVEYIPIARDATVAWGSFDMKFKNDTDAPIFISYTTRGNRATARLYGPKSAKRDVRINTVSKEIGEREIKAKLFRTIRKNGKVVNKEEVGTSHYRWKKDEEAED